MSLRSTVELLRRVSLFEGLEESELKALAETTSSRTYPRDNVIILAEDQGDSMFIIQRGRVKVSIVSEDGREVILSSLGAGDFFGDMSLLDSKPRSANVTASEETDLLMLRRADFIRLLQTVPQIAIKLLAVLAGRLRKTDRKIEGLALSDVTGRITQTLLQLGEDQGTYTKEGVLIRNRPTHQELANMSGTTRETVSRILKRLENQGYITYRGRDLIILKDDLPHKDT